jgi:signal transduction histidine kinase/ligand-binding sensor domain-containing protein/CheY-like chemotaxis protein
MLTRRRHRLLEVLALLGLLLLSGPGLAGKPLALFAYERWTSEDGLPEDTVSAIAETGNGFLWFATGNGLARFDGNHVEPVPALRGGPFEAGSTALWVAPDDALWVGTVNRGLWRLQINEPPQQWTTAQGLPANAILSLAEGLDGALLIGTSRGAARLLDGRIEPLRRVPQVPIRAIAVAADGTRWLLGNADVAYRQGAGGTVAEIALPGGAGAAVAVDRRGHAWLATGDGLLEIDQAGRPTLHRVQPGGLASTLIRALMVARDGSLWIAFEGQGVQRLHEGGWQGFAAAEGLHNAYVGALFEDSHGSMWLGTGLGVARLRDAAVSTYSRAHGLAADYVRSVAVDAAGIAWIGTDGGGLARVDGVRATSYTSANGLLGDTVRAVAVAADGSVWIGAYGRGLQRFADGRFENLQADAGLPSARIAALLAEADGTLWIGTEDRGLVRLRAGRFEVFDQARGMPSNDIRSLLRRADGALLAGSSDRGIAVLVDDRVERVLDRASGLLCERINAMYEDAAGTLWVGAENGLMRVSGDRVLGLADQDPVLAHAVRFVGGDADGGIWVAGGRGVVHLAAAGVAALAAGTAGTEALPIRRVGRSDGLRAPQVNGGTQPSAALGGDGRLWLPTPRGLAVVDPARLADEAPLPRMQIESLRGNGELLPLVAVRHALAAGVTRVEVGFGGVQTLGLDRPLYQIRLDGLDADWKRPSSERIVEYASLPPGEYTFRVRAVAEHGGRVSDEATVRFTVTPQFYQHAGFLALLGLAMVASIAAAVGLRHRRLLADKRRLTAEVERRTLELRDALGHAQQLARAKATFLANMSHELRTPLSAIIGFTEHALHGGPTAAPYALTRIERHSRLLLELVNDVLDASRIDAGQLCVEIQPVSPLEVAAEVVQLLEDRATDKGLAIRLQPRWPLPATVPADPLRLKQVLLNLVGNAIKFSERGTITLTLGADAATGHWWVEVADEGIGISEEQQGRLFRAFEQADVSVSRRHGGSGLGLYISRKLVSLSGGTIMVESTPGRGSRFRVALPLADDCEWLDGPPAAAGGDEAPVTVPSLRGRVLLAEDAEDLRLLLAGVIESTGAELVAVENGLEAVRQATAAPFDLVLMDMHMPVLDGNAATRRLRAGGYRGAIVALTADVLADAVSNHRAAGCDWVLTKPIDRRRLFSLLSLFLTEAEPVDATDPQAFDALHARLSVRFRLRLRTEAAALQAADWRRQGSELAERLHRLKGSCGMFGLAEVGAAAATAERALRDGDGRRFPAALAALVALVEQQDRLVDAASETVVRALDRHQNATEDALRQ